MFDFAGLNTAIVNALYVEIRDSVRWLFDDMSIDTRARRQHALTSLVELQPASSLEARLALQVVVNDIHATDCFCAAARNREDEVKVRQDRAQGNALQRQSHRALRLLMQMQNARRAVEAGQATQPAPAAQHPLPQPASAPVQAQPAAAAPATAPATARPLPAAAPSEPRPAIAASAATVIATPTPPPAPETPAPQAPAPQAPAPQAPAPQAPASPTPALASPPSAGAPGALPRPRQFSQIALARAETLAIRKQPLAIRIRRAGGLTPETIDGFDRAPWLDDAEVVAALVHGVSPILKLLDAESPAIKKAA